MVNSQLRPLPLSQFPGEGDEPGTLLQPVLALPSTKRSFLLTSTLVRTKLDIASFSSSQKSGIQFKMERKKHLGYVKVFEEES